MAQAAAGRGRRVSFVLNVAHAEPTWAARGVALIPPAALVLGVELLMMVLRRATTCAPPASRSRPRPPRRRPWPRPGQDPDRGHAPAQAGARDRPRDLDRPAGPARPGRGQGGGAAPAGPRAAGVGGRGAPADTFREAVAAAKADDDARPRRRQAPYMVAAAILDERSDADSLTAAQLVEAMAEHGVTISQSTAQALLRELRSPSRPACRTAGPPGSPGRPAPPTAAARPPAPAGRPPAVR